MLKMLLVLLLLTSCATTTFTDKCGTFKMSAPFGSDISLTGATIRISANCDKEIVINGLQDMQSKTVTEISGRIAEGVTKGLVEGAK